MSKLVGLDIGLRNQFVRIKNDKNDDEYTGQIVGVYNEELFMWNPTIYTTISVFTCTDQHSALDTFR